MDYKKELAATVAELPQEPPAETIQTLIDRGCLRGEALVYKCAWMPGENGKKEKVVEVHCTACGATMYLPYEKLEEPCNYRYEYQAPYGFREPHHNELIYHRLDVLCPDCGAQVNVRHISSFCGETDGLAQTSCMSVHEVRGHLCLLKWDIFKNTDKNGKVIIHKHKLEGFIVIGKRKFRVCGYTKANMCSGYYHDWEIRKTYTEKFGAASKRVVIPFNRKTVYATECANSALYEFMNQCKGYCRPTVYLRLWLKYPQLENIVRAGFGNMLGSLIEESMSGSYYSDKETVNEERIKNFLDLKKVKPADILKITKQEIPVAKNCDVDTFRLYRFLKKERGIRLTEEHVKKAAKINPKYLLELFSQWQVPVIHTINYLYKKRFEPGASGLIEPKYLTDYWNMLQNVYGEIPESVRFPKDLVFAHDEVLKLQTEKIERETSEMIAAQAKVYEDYAFEDESLHLMIRPVQSQQELIDEGAARDHCVARYAGAVAKGKTMIFFIRNTDEPEKPFYTLEYRDGFVNQNRGRGNCARTQEVQLFEQLWLEKIKNIRRKKDGTDGKNGNSADAAS